MCVCVLYYNYADNNRAFVTLYSCPKNIKLQIKLACKQIIEH